MGGYGSGRGWQYGSRATTDDLLRLDIRQINRDLLVANQSYQWKWRRVGQAPATIDVRTEFDRLILSYRARNRGDEAWIDRHQTVHLSWSDCNYGGCRPWFLCPAQGCGRRCAILYGGHLFACRKCHGLAYASQRENIPDRLARRVDKLRNRLGWQPGLLNADGPKPRGMHKNTFDNMVYRHNQLKQVVLGCIFKSLGGRDDRFF